MRLKYLQYCPCIVAQLDDLHLLQQILMWYSPPSSPRTYDEWLYLQLVCEATEKRIEEIERLNPKPSTSQEKFDVEAAFGNLKF